MRSFLTIMSVAFVAAIAGIALTNALVDPWSLFPQLHLKELKRPQLEPHARLHKDTRVLRGNFDVVYLGSSRVDVGLPVFTERGFNLAYPGGGLEESLDMARVLMASGKAKVLMIGLDFDRFKHPGDRNRAAHLECLQDRSASCMIEIARKYLLTFDALLDSAKTLAKNFLGSAHDVYRPDGQRTDDYMHRLRGNQPSSEIFRKFFDGEARTLKDSAVLRSKFELLEDFCTRAGQYPAVRVVLVVLPYHDSWLSFVREAGLEAQFKGWLDDVRGMKNCTRYAEVRDYHRLPGVSSEPVAGAVSEMQHFWDPTHFKSQTGKRVVQLLFPKVARHPGLI